MKPLTRALLLIVIGGSALMFAAFSRWTLDHILETERMVASMVADQVRLRHDLARLDQRANLAAADLDFLRRNAILTMSATSQDSRYTWQQLMNLEKDVWESERKISDQLFEIARGIQDIKQAQQPTRRFGDPLNQR
jgi:hypothetical protein